MRVVAFLTKVHIFALLEFALSIIKVTAYFSLTFSRAPRYKRLHSRCCRHLGQLMVQCVGMRANWAC